MSFNRDVLPSPADYFELQGMSLKGPHSAKWKTTNCNFHGGSDSMRVNVATGAWLCMNCHVKGGDVLAYEMTASGRDFVDAAKALGLDQRDLISVVADPIFNTQPSVIHKVRFVVGDQCHP